MFFELLVILLDFKVERIKFHGGVKCSLNHLHSIMLLEESYREQPEEQSCDRVPVRYAKPKPAQFDNFVVIMIFIIVVARVPDRAKLPERNDLQHPESR